MQWYRISIAPKKPCRIDKEEMAQCRGGSLHKLPWHEAISFPFLFARSTNFSKFWNKLGGLGHRWCWKKDVTSARKCTPILMLVYQLRCPTYETKNETSPSFSIIVPLHLRLARVYQHWKNQNQKRKKKDHAVVYLLSQLMEWFLDT